MLEGLTKLRFLATVIACACIFGTIPSAKVGLNEPVATSVHIGVPPPSLWGDGKSGVKLPFGPITGSVSYNTLGKCVDIKWRYRSVPSSPVTVTEKQTIALSYWPTEVLRIDSNTFLVAGKRERGATVIERFSISSPYIYIPPPPAGVQIYPAVVTSIDELFAEKEVGMDMVLAMHLLRGPSNGVLVQFQDSRDVYQLSLDDGQFSIVASPSSSGVGILTVPDLSMNVSRTFSRDHIQWGYIYGFQGTTPGGEILLLVDDYRDDVLDYFMTLTDADWDTLNLSDPATYQ